MKKLITTVFITIVSVFPSISQNYEPTLEDRKLMFQDYYFLKDWVKVVPHLEYIVANAPDAGEKYYVKGIKVYNNLIKSSTDDNKIAEYQLKTLNLFEKRIEIYGSTNKMQNQYLSTTYRYWIKTPTQYDTLLSMFTQRIETDANAVSSSNLMAYFDVLRRAKRQGSSIDDTAILNNYDKITTVMEVRGDEKGYMKKIDQMLFKIVALNCEKIEEIFDKELTEVNSAKQYLNMVFKMDCDISDKAELALELILKNEPEYKLAMDAAKKSMIDGRLSDAEKYLGMALALITEKDQESEIYLQLAKTMTLKKNKFEAYKFAKQSISKGKSSEAYSLIGNLYLSSFDECIGEKDIVARRAVFIAAYDKFKIANDTKNMAVAAAQFPSMEEIHFNNYELGQPMIVDCWFKEEIVLARRAKSE
jgi:hypothetical protein